MSDGFADRVRDVLKDPQSLPQEFTDWVVQHTAMNPVPVQTIRAPAVQATGLDGSHQSTRYVGATTSGHPTTGYYLKGDYAIDQSGDIWICTASGSPGTWVDVGASGTQPAIGARIENVGGQSVATSTRTDLTYDTTRFDTDGMVNLVSNNKILTVNTAGIYMVTCATIFEQNFVGRRIGAAIQNAYYSAASTPETAAAFDTRNAIWTDFADGPVHTGTLAVGVFHAAVSDFFSSGAFQASGSSLSVGGFTNSFLAATLIGAD